MDMVRLLQDKIGAEFDSFYRELLDKSPKEILETAYEYVSKLNISDVLLCDRKVLEELPLSVQGKALNIRDLLDWIYTYWLKMDTNDSATLAENIKYIFKSRDLPESKTSIFA